MQHHGTGLELLGTILASAGWAIAALVTALFLGAWGSGGVPPGDIVLPLAGSLISALALAGLGHLLRAVAQLGRNVHRLGAMLREARPPP